MNTHFIKATVPLSLQKRLQNGKINTIKTYHFSDNHQLSASVPNSITLHYIHRAYGYKENGFEQADKNIHGCAYQLPPKTTKLTGTAEFYGRLLKTEANLATVQLVSKKNYKEELTRQRLALYNINEDIIPFYEPQFLVVTIDAALLTPITLKEFYIQAPKTPVARKPQRKLTQNLHEFLTKNKKEIYLAYQLNRYPQLPSFYIDPNNQTPINDHVKINDHYFAVSGSSSRIFSETLDLTMTPITKKDVRKAFLFQKQLFEFLNQNIEHESQTPTTNELLDTFLLEINNPDRLNLELYFENTNPQFENTINFTLDLLDPSRNEYNHITDQYIGPELITFLQKGIDSLNPQR